MPKLKKIFLASFIVITILSFNTARAEDAETTEPPIINPEENTEEAPPETGTPLEIDISIDVPATCQVKDKDNEEHSYSGASPDSYVAICALQAALDEGLLEDAEFSNEFPSMGLFVTSLNGIEADPNSQYWSLYYNDDFAQLGISSLPVSEGDKLALKLFDFSGNGSGDSVVIRIDSLIPASTEEPSGGNSSGSSSNRKAKKTGEVLGAQTAPAFDIKKAYEFLLSQQKENGSLGEELYTDWAALAIASGETQKIEPVLKLVKYLSTTKPAGTLLTDHERHAMALMALGLNPYNAGGVNYIKKITDSFDGGQFGDTNEDNDDIFALLVLLNAGYDKSEKMLGNSLAFVLGRQRENGSWDESIDMTGAGIQLLSLFPENEGARNALSKAREFLKATQKDNGSWNDDVSSTAWALGGIIALGEKPEDWKGKYDSPLDYLLALQGSDGGISGDTIENRTWQTAYAISALSGKTWSQVMQKFEKIEIPATLTPAEELPNTANLKTTVTPKPQPKIKAEVKPAVLNKVAPIPAPAPAPAPIPGTPSTQNQPEEKGWFAKFLGIFQRD